MYFGVNVPEGVVDVLLMVLSTEVLLPDENGTGEIGLVK